VVKICGRRGEPGVELDIRRIGVWDVVREAYTYKH